MHQVTSSVLRCKVNVVVNCYLGSVSILCLGLTLTPLLFQAVGLRGKSLPALNLRFLIYKVDMTRLPSQAVCGGKTVDTSGAHCTQARTEPQLWYCGHSPNFPQDEPALIYLRYCSVRGPEPRSCGKVASSIPKESRAPRPTSPMQSVPGEGQESVRKSELAE